MDKYLIPANSKKSQLILGYFTPFDLGVFGIGVTFTLVMLILIKTNDIAKMVFILSPALVTGFLVMPVPNYHNVMTLLGNIWKFYTGRKKYYWRGWCVQYESRNSEKRKF